MRFIILIIGTLLAVTFLTQLNKGKRFEALVVGLDGMEYQFHNLFIVGFSWSTSKLFAFKGKVAAKLRQEAALLYERKYIDYYANIVWAQTITYVHLFLTFTFLLAGIFFNNFAFVMAAGLFITVFMSVYSFTIMQNTINKRKEECESQLAEVVSTMAVLLNTGMILKDVWQLVGQNGEGQLYELMRKATSNMNSGMTEKDALYNFGRTSNSQEIRKFTSALLQSMEKGGAELSGFMQQQSSELWHMRRQRMLQSGEKASTKLLLPIVLVFFGVMIIVLTAAVGGTLFK